MASRFLESMKISNGSDGTTAGKSPNAAPALSESTTHGGVSQRNYGSRGVEGHRAVVARKRARKWTDGERDLAEQEMAMVIVERQQVRLVYIGVLVIVYGGIWMTSIKKDNYRKLYFWFHRLIV